jgi:hypothetical protein
MPAADSNSLTFLCQLCHRTFEVQASEDRHVRRCPHCQRNVVVLLNLPEKAQSQPTGAPIVEQRLPLEPVEESRNDVADPLLASGPVIVPTTLYVVAALFFADGIFYLIQTIAYVITTPRLDIIGLLVSLCVAIVILWTGWGLARIRQTSVGWAVLLLRLGIIGRAIVVLMLATFFVDYLTQRISSESSSALRRGSSYHWRIGPVFRVSGSASDNVGWYKISNDRERALEPIVVSLVGSYLLLGVGLNWWQLRVLRRPATRLAFYEANRNELVGQMSLTRFFALITLILSIYLAIWQSGWRLML